MSNKVATDEWYEGSVQEEWILQVKAKYKSQIDILETKNNTRVYLFILFKQVFNMPYVFSYYLTYTC